METLLQELVQHWEAIEAFFAFDATRLADTDIRIRLGIQALLLGCSAYFSGSETALFSLSRLDLQKLRRERHRHSETLHALLDQPRRLIISILCGNELVNIAAAANMTAILVSLYDVERAGDLKFGEVAGLIAEVPAADIDWLTRRIVQLQRIDLREVGVRQDFVDHDARNRPRSRGSGRAAKFTATAEIPITLINCVMDSGASFRK